MKRNQDANKNRNKLTFNKQTIRELTIPALEDSAGGREMRKPPTTATTSDDCC